ncbi:uncharacterized protein At2g27730, mitochondrial [Eucalyptus grandis]|uniref:uncharacterized protein At2g27730, mitochondrial n=1 Tax=Eucalyptus grandis TaxID=71139 RepID=UPI000524F905|nr:uncharacterized protein At2g27730, mitochondrial [Eucalyptus grandis]
MAMRSAASRASAIRVAGPARVGATRLFSAGKGKILGEEERAAENVFIQKMERERLEKMKHKAEKEKAEKEKEAAEKKPGEK